MNATKDKVEGHYPNASCPDCYTRGIWHLPAGTCTGRFRNRGDLHHGFYPGILACVEESSARQGTMIFSAPGGGKTRAGILPKIRAALAADPQSGAIIPAVKANLVYQAIAIARQTRHPYRVFAMKGSLPKSIPARDGGDPIEIVISTMSAWGRMSPDAVGASYRDALKSSADEFWRAAPASLCANFARLLRGLGEQTVVIPGPVLEGPDGKPVKLPPRVKRDEDGVPLVNEDGEPEMMPADFERGPDHPITLSYSPLGLYASIFAPKEAIDKWLGFAVAELAKIQSTLASSETPAEDIDDLRSRQRDLNGTILYLQGAYRKLFDRETDTFRNVVTTLEPYLSALVADDRISDAFANGEEQDICALADTGTVCIIYISHDDFPQAARLIPNLIFRQVATFAASRLTKPGYKHPFLLVLDEYGTFAAEEHVGPLEKVRESNIVVIASAISIPNLSESVGKQDAALAIVACFSTLQIFQISDEITKKFVKDRAGTVNVMRRSITPGTGPVRDHWHRLQRITGQDTSYNFSPTPQPIIADEDFADLGAFDGKATSIFFTPNQGTDRRDFISCPIETNEMLGLADDIVQAVI